MMDVAQGRSRGFGFVTFEDGSGGAQKALASQPLYIDNKYVEIKLAQPKGSQNAEHGKKYVHQNAGLRNASLATLQSKGEFAGFAASYGRNGWKAGYGSYAFGKGGWGVQDWETFLDLPEKSGFSFDRLFVHVEKKEDSRRRTVSRQRKRDYHEANLRELHDKQEEPDHVSGGSHKRSRR
jgi:RNA recognition motif-containing protein